MSIDNSYEDPNPEKQNMDAPQEEFIDDGGNSRDQSEQAPPTQRDSNKPEPQKQAVILLPPTHEQSNPSFHVQGSLAADFIRFLGGKGYRAWEPVSKIDKVGSDNHRVVEIDIESDTPMDKLEALIKEFQQSQSTPQP